MDSAENIARVPPGAEVRLVRSATPTALAASANGHRSLRDAWKMSRAMSDPLFDLLVFPTVYSYVPVFSRAKKLVIIHDIIAEMYPRLTLPSAGARLLWKVKVALGCWQADAVATVSEYSRQGIVKRLKLAPERVFIVGEASDPVFQVLADPQPTSRLSALGITANSRMVLYVGGFGPHKNLQALVLAFAKIAAQREFADVLLVMVGENQQEVFHSYFAHIKDQVARLGMTKRVVFTGYLPDEDLVVLLNLGTVLVLPSLMEGFGLPAIEAAACGCPVIATTASPLPVLLGDASLYIDPVNHPELVFALTRVLAAESLRQQMRKAGLAAARQLTWDAAARQMVNLIRMVTAS
ncbi:MAG: glycosyltransferase family 4 protein [Candidatus Entotheonellia bacterium]